MRSDEEIREALRHIPIEEEWCCVDARSILAEAITELLTLRRALSMEPENVERYHKDLEISDIDIRHVISGIRRRVGLEV